MVQNSIRRGDYFNPRDGNARSNFHSQDNRNPEFITDDRYNLKPQPTQQHPVHPHPLSIEAALRECAGVPVRAFALCVVDANNDERFYTSENLTRHQQQIFSERFKVDVRKALRRGNLRSHPFSVAQEDDYDSHQQSWSGGSSSEGRQRMYIKESRSDDSEEDSTTRRRKRSRPTLYTDDDTPAPVPVQKTMPLVISDEVEVNKFYEQRFKDMQQSSCKVMGKAFVKLVEPKKQTNHPYTKGDDMAPDWWPINGDANERVKHREPDHLLKPERIRLLVHILKMAVEPVHRQHASAAKVGLNVKKLEEAALEVMVPWFNDKDHPDNAAKRTFFKEIFKVAKQEERFKNGEIDGTTRVHVMIDRAGMDNSDDDGDDDEEGMREDEINENHTPTSSAAPSVTDIVSSSVNQTQHPPQPLHPEPEIPYRIQPTIRYTSRPPMDDHTSYADSSFMPRTVQNTAYQPMSPSPLQESNRRFYSPGHASPQQMYGWGQTNNMVNHSTPNYFVNSPQHGLLNHPPPYLPPPPGPLTMLPPPMPPMPHHYDLQSSPRYDTGSPMGQPLRSGSIGHPQSHNVLHGQNYTDYIHEPGPPIHHNTDMKVDVNTDLYDE